MQELEQVWITSRKQQKCIHTYANKSFARKEKEMVRIAMSFKIQCSLVSDFLEGMLYG